MEEVIQDTNQITVDWLSSCLKENGYLNECAIANIKNIAEAKRYVSKSFYISVEYEGRRGADLPDAFFLKLYDFGLTGELCGKKEVEFFRLFPELMKEFHFIKCYCSCHIPEKSYAFLLFADVSNEVIIPQQLDWEREPTKAQIEKIVEHLSRFHAYWWDHSKLGTDVGRHLDTDSYRKYVELNERRYRYFRDTLKHRLPQKRREIFEKILLRWEVLYNRLNRRKNLTICHGDTNIYNILWPRMFDSERLYLVDWNYWHINIGALDIAYLLSLTLNPKIRERVEQDIIRFYYDCLTKHGVKNYSFDDFQYDYKISLAAVLFTPVALCEWQLPFLAWWGQYRRSFMAFESMNCMDLFD